MKILTCLLTVFLMLPVAVSAETNADKGLIGEDYDLLTDFEYQTDSVLVANGGTYKSDYTEPKPAKPIASSNWQFMIAPYLWFAGIEGDQGIGGNEFEIDVSFGDIWDVLDFAFQIHAEAMKDKYFFFIDETYLKLSTDKEINPGPLLPAGADLELSLKQNLLELGGGYRIAEGTEYPIYLDLLGGIRWFYIDTELEINAADADDTEQWVDFILGARAIAYLTDSLFATVRTDFGGFGLDFSSDFSWNFIVNLGWDSGWHGVTPIIGWRTLYVDYEDGSGSDQFLYDVWQNGIQAGVGFRF